MNAVADTPPSVSEEYLRWSWDLFRRSQLPDLERRLERASGENRRYLKAQVKAYRSPDPPRGWEPAPVDGSRTITAEPPRDGRGRRLRRLGPEEHLPPGYGFAPETPVGDLVVWVPVEEAEEDEA